MEEVEKVKDELSDRNIAERLEGRGGGLRTSKPQAKEDDGLVQFIWRQARFHSGEDTSMPVTSYFWLDSWLEEENIDASVSGVKDEEGEKILDLIDDFVVVLLSEHFGKDPTKAAKRWGGLLY